MNRELLEFWILDFGFGIGCSERPIPNPHERQRLTLVKSKIQNRLRLIILILLCWMGLAAAVRAQQAVPELTGRIVDLAEVLAPATEQTLAALLAVHEDSTSNQVVVLTIPSLEGEAIEAFSLRVAETWALGTAAGDNGVLLLVAIEDRGLRIEVGYGLEGALPDVIAGRIIRDEMVPYFREGNYERGIEAGVLAVLAQLEGQGETVDPLGIVEGETESVEETTNVSWLDWWSIVYAAYFLAGLVLLCVTAALALLEKMPKPHLIFFLLVPYAYFVGMNLYIAFFLFLPELVVPLVVVGVYGIVFQVLAWRIAADAAFKATWRRHLLVHPADPEASDKKPDKKSEAASEEAVAPMAASRYPRMIQLVVLIAFTTLLGFTLGYRMAFSLFVLIVSAVMAWYCLSRIAENAEQRKQRRSTLWTPFGRAPLRTGSSGSLRSSRSRRRSYTSSSWSSRSSSSSSWSSSSSSSYSSSSSSSSSSYSGGGGSFGGGGASGSW